MCNLEATTREHAPPVCIFPESKDMDDGIDYRKELITVPSCDAHNLHKSKEDEYLQLLVINGYFNNSLANKQFKTKLTRAFSRRPALLAAFHSDKTPVVVNGEETYAVSIDTVRFNKCIEMIVRALYFDTFGKQLLMPIRVESPLLLAMDHENADKINQLVKNYSLAVRKHLKNEVKLGSNPDIFWFRIKHNHERNLVACHMMFYGGFDVFATAK